jgi:hypothetical protein
MLAHQPTQFEAVEYHACFKQINYHNRKLGHGVTFKLGTIFITYINCFLTLMGA